MFGLSEIALVLAFLVAVLAYFWPRSSKAEKRVMDASFNLPKAPKEKPKAVEEDKSGKPPMVVFYGSQSGTAEGFANDLCEEANAYGFNAKVVNLEGYEAETDLVGEKFAVFLMATFGEGEPTDNAVEFFNWLMSEDRDTESMKPLDFAVFGLGNRQYEHFCTIGKKVDKRLDELGGQRLCNVGIGDDDGSIEDDFSNWKKDFWAKARSKFLGVSESDTSQAEVKFEGAFNIEYYPPPRIVRGSNKKKDDEYDYDGEFKDFESEEKAKVDDEKRIAPNYKGGLDSFHADPKHKAEVAPVAVVRELRQDIKDGGSTCHIEFDLTKLRLRYITADNLGVYPRNDHKIVGRLARRFRVHPDTIFELKFKNSNNKRKPPVPSPCSVRDALLWYCDLTHLPRGKTLLALAQYATKETEKQQLINLATTDKHRFDENMMSLWEVMEDFPSINIPFQDFLEICPRLQPRFYTISSSSKLTPRSVHITVSLSVLNKPSKTIMGNERTLGLNGVCTDYLCGLKESKDRVCIFVRPSSFRLPIKLGTPIIMVGPGTGVAPFRAFIQEEYALRQQKKKVMKAYPDEDEEKEPESKDIKSLPRQLGAMSLYFGCRQKNADWIYREEMQTAVTDAVLNDLVLAFSREHGEKKVYVQDRMAENAEQLWKQLSEQNAYFYVCGGTQMGRSVKDTLLTVAQRQGRLTEKQAHDLIDKMVHSQRYIQELWS